MVSRYSLVFLPPGGGDTAGWGEHLNNFRRHYDVIPIDMPGAGSNVSHEPLGTILECASYVEGFVTAVDLKNIVLIGYSMGGLIGQALAIRNPRAYAGLVLVATAARIKIMPEILDVLENNPGEAQKMIDKFARNPNRAYSEGFGSPNAKSMHAYLSATNNYDARDNVSSIVTPTLILHGDQDLTCPVKFGKWLHEEIPNSQLEILPGAGHMLPQEFPRELENAVEQFLLNLDEMHTLS